MKSSAVALILGVACLIGAAPAAGQPQAQPRWATVSEPPALPKPDESGFVDHDGARLYYAVFHKGGGRPVILLHGGLGSSDSFGFEVPRLARHHEVIVMDSRGQGRSSGLDRPLTYDLMEADVLAVLDSLRVRKASVVGLSDGGIIGLVMAVRHPNRVDRLFAWGANFNDHAQPATPPDPALKAVGAAYMARMQVEYRRLSPTPDGFPALLKAMGALKPNLTPQELSRIAAPTVIADGDHEQFIAREHTELMARLIPQARLVIIPDVSHGGATQDPEAFHRAVASLLDP